MVINGYKVQTRNMIPVGLAICDVVLDEYTCARIVGDTYKGRQLEKMDVDGVELQLERWGQYNIFYRGSTVPHFLAEGAVGDDLLTKAIQELRSKPFKSYHGPIFTGNISSPNEAIREQALEMTLKSMEAAQVFGAQVYVLHPSTYEWNYWKQFRNQFKNYMELRKSSIDFFLGALKQLAEQYAGKGYTFQMGIENLEFNQFPATTMEIDELLRKSNEVWKEANPHGRVGLVLDFQHLKHSKALLEDNTPEPMQFFCSTEEVEALHRYAHIPICRDHDYVPLEGEPEPILNRFLKDHLNDIVLIHFGGNDERHATHDPILYDIGTHKYSKKDYDEGVLNIKQVLDNIFFSGYQGAIVLEVRGRSQHFETKFEQEITTLRNVQRYLRDLEDRTKTGLKEK